MAFSARRPATVVVGNRLERAERPRVPLPLAARISPLRRRGDARAERLVELFGLAFSEPR
jgi:hypothetical protein